MIREKEVEDVELEIEDVDEEDSGGEELPGTKNSSLVSLLF